jgi:hypothetical protein
VPAGRESGWIDESCADELLLRWVFSRDEFESHLYDFPIWNFRVETDWPANGPLHPDDLKHAMASSIGRLIAAPRLTPSYLFSRVVQSEPLYGMLLECGFQQVEARRIYRTRVGELANEQAATDESILFTSLDRIARERRGFLREQMLSLCEEAFGEKGYSRHFADPFLSARTPGRAYIVAAMRLNFERMSPDAFLLALEQCSLLCGFSVFGKKAGRDSEIFTQMLSAVRNDYQGRQVYQGMTRLLIESLPRDAILLNTTHAGNTAMLAAYEHSGRVHLADTVVLRRVIQ